MIGKLSAVCLSAGLLFAAPNAYAYELKATAYLNVDGDNVTARLCRTAPNQAVTRTKNFSKKNKCTEHQSCTDLKNVAKLALRDLQTGQFLVCTKYLSAFNRCEDACD